MEINLRVNNKRRTPPASLYRQLAAKAEAAPDNDSNWLITLSDLLTLLLIFFIFIFLTSAKKGLPAAADQQARPVAPQKEQLQQGALPAVLSSERDEIMKALEGEDGLAVASEREEIVITLREKITFRPGEAELLKTSQPVLDKVGSLLSRYPSYTVEIDGHTDNVPISTRLYPSNWELSVDRATKVLKYLLATTNMDPSRFYLKGNADLRPSVPNDSPEQRAENRRVEIRLKKAPALPAN